jgi:hypothetical protein
MNLQKFFGIAFSTAVLSSTLLTGTSYGAGTATGMPGSSTADLSPELQSAGQRVDMSKAKLDQARQQLSAAKAMLRAAEAEFKAAQADQNALSLRSEARKLADASGLQDTGTVGNRLYPVDMSQIKSTPATAPGTSAGTTTPSGVSAAGPTMMMGVGADNRLQPSNDANQSSATPPASTNGAPTPSTGM